METEQVRNPKLKSPQNARRDACHSRRLWIRLTFCCNNRCLFCHDSGSRDKGIVPFATVIERLERGIHEGFREVVLSGGEPTLHPDFISIVKHAKDMGYHWVQTVSNGRAFFYPAFCRDCILAGLDEVTFSVHECTEAGHDRLTGVLGSFAQSIKGLRNMIALHRCTISIDIVVTRLNAGRLVEIIRYFIDLGVREFDLLHLIPFGSAVDNFRLLHYDPIENAAPIRNAFDFASLKGVRISTNRMPLKTLEGYEHLSQPPEKLAEEIHGHSDVFLEYLRGGRKPACAGKHCGACFLEAFCRGLFEQETMRRRGTTRQMLWDTARTHSLADFPYGSLEGKHLWFITRGSKLPTKFWEKLHTAEPASVTFAALDPTAASRLIKQANTSGTPPTRIILSSWDNSAFEGRHPLPLEIWLPLNRNSWNVVQSLPDIARRTTLYMPSFILSSDSGSLTPAETVSLISKMHATPVKFFGIPPCLAPGGRVTPNFRFFFISSIDKSGYIDLSKYTETYLRYMYYEKSARCDECRCTNHCRGLSFEDITGGIGLSALNPLPVAGNKT